MDTPVAFFIFRRPETTSRVFQTIRAARPKTLFLIADGPRQGAEFEMKLTEQTRAIVREIDWPCDVHRIYSEKNLGLRDRVLSGLDTVFSKVDRAIILEDDCLPNASFFGFCSELLSRYSAATEVGIVSGFNFSPFYDEKSDYFFSRSTYIWGWATWAETWQAFRASPQVESWSETELQELKPTFASRIQEREFLAMAKSAENLNTWDISLAVWVRQSNFYTVIPNRNLITNIGFGQEATHTKFEAFDVQAPVSDYFGPIRHPESIVYDSKIEKLAWRKKILRWATFPVKHPIDFLRRVIAFLKTKNQSKST